MPPGEKKVFKNYISICHLAQSYFPILILSPLERRCDSSFQHILVPFTQVWLKLAKLFLRKRFLKVVNVFSLCSYYLPLKKCMALNLNKFEFPLPKNTLCHVWLKFAQRFWRKFSKVVNIFNFYYYLPLEKGQGLSIERN